MVKKKVARPVQLTFARLLDGLRRRGGRKKSPDSGVPHLKRERVTERTPVLITIKLLEGLPDLRQGAEYQVIWNAMLAARERPGRSTTGGFRLVDYAILGNHCHFIIEALDNDSLSRGMNGLCGRIAKGLDLEDRARGPHRQALRVREREEAPAADGLGPAGSVQLRRVVRGLEGLRERRLGGVEGAGGEGHELVVAGGLEEVRAARAQACVGQDHPRGEVTPKGAISA